MRNSTVSGHRPQATLSIAFLGMWLLGGLCAHAVELTSTWNGSTGNWSDATRWSTNPLFPNNGNGGNDFNAVVGGGTVTLDQDISIEGLTIANGGIDGSFDLELSGQSTWYRGSMTGSGITTIASGGTFNVASANGDGPNLRRLLVNNGSTTWTGGGIWYMQDGAFTNNGTFTADVGATKDLRTGGGTNVFNNLGSFVNRESSTIGVTFNNTGTVDIQGGQLNLFGGGTHSGDFTIASGTKLAIGGSHEFAVTSDLSGSGTLEIGSGTMTLAGTINVGTLDVSFGTLTGSGNITAGSLSILSGSLGGSGNATFTGASFWGRGSMTGSGITTIASGGTFNVANTNGDGPNLRRLLVNNGSTTWTGGGIWYMQDGAFTNNGTFTADVGGTKDLRTAGGTNAFNNLGSFVNRESSTIGVTFNNTGTVDVQAGQLNLHSGGTHSGSFGGVIGTNLSLGGTHLFNGTSSFSGAGAKTFGGTFRNQGVFNWSGATISLIGFTMFDNQGVTNLNDSGTAFDIGNGSPTVVNERTGVLLKNGAGITTIAVPTTNHGRIESNGGTIAFSAGLTNSPTGTLGGNGTFALNLTNSGRVAPGNSPGILTIQGNYTQTASGILEIEVGGLTPGTQHDRLDVIPNANPGSGVATLGGALVVPIINGFVPAINDQITFLNASSVVGNFDRYFMVNPAPGRAIQVIRSPTSVDLKFVASTSATQAPLITGTNEWSNLTTWSTPVPTETDVVSLTNTELTALRVNVSTDNAFTDRLNVSGGQATTTLGVQNGKALSATAGIEIDQAGIIELSDGGLSTATVTVDTGGMLTGNGTLYGDLVAGTNLGAVNAMVEPGINGVGSLTIDGSYLQGAGGVFGVDLPGTNAAGTFDRISVQQDVALAGKLQIDANGLTNGEFVPGAPYQIATVGGTVTGEFDQIEVLGRPDLYFDVNYGAPSAAAADDPQALTAGAAITVSGFFRGDGTQDGIINDQDATVFAAVLVDATLGSVDCGNGCFAAADFLDAYDFVDTTPDDLRTVDFFDLPYFAAAMSNSSGVSLAAAYAQIDSAIQAAQVTVPEPTSLVLTLLASAGFLHRGRKVAHV